MASAWRRSAILGVLLVVVLVTGNNLYRHSSVVNNLIIKFERLKGFTPTTLPEARRAQSCSTVFFAGHLYPKNGIRLARKPDIPNQDNSLEVFLRWTEALGPERTILGGDSIYLPDPEFVDEILEAFQHVPGTVFISGNHDNYWDMQALSADATQRMFSQRFFYEDLEGVRLVYLHSFDQAGEMGLDRQQNEFLAAVLGSDEYRYALVFLHHALWAGGRKVTNSFPIDTGRAGWYEEVLPLLQSGKVAAVFAGDGSAYRPGVVEDVGGITHVITGWPSQRPDIATEWISIGLCDRSPIITRYRLLNGEVYRNSAEAAWQPSTAQ